jgi:hypothetical protein
MRPFCPAKPGNTQSISVTAASAKITVGGETARLYNRGSDPVAVRWGVGNQTAEFAKDMKIPGGHVEIVALGAANCLAAICDTSKTATLDVTPGTGGL